MAANNYKVSTGFKFITYAVFWIRKFITEYLAKNGRVVRLPSNKIHGISKLNKKIDHLEQQLGRTADITEIIEAFSGDLDKKAIIALEMELRGLLEQGAKDFAFIGKTSVLAGSPWKFSKHGECGQSLSSLLPQLAEVVDELAVIRSVHSDEINHAPAQMFLHSGFGRGGRCCGWRPG